MRAYNFGGSWRPRNLMKLYQVMQVVAQVITLTLILQGVPPQNLGWQKCPKFSAIFNNFRLRSRISQELNDLSKNIIVIVNYISSLFCEKKFGELWSTNKKVIGTHVDPPNWTFSGDYISALGGAGPSNFLTPY